MDQKGKKQESVFIKEVRRDIHTFKRLDGRKRVRFIWDYYKWKIIAAVTAMAIIITFTNLLWQGQKPCRLRVCVVLNNDQSCKDWFHTFFEDLSSDGKKGALDLDEDQPFDYKNAYVNVQELEVRTKIGAQRIDVAVCGPDMYSFLLALNACTALDTVLPEETVSLLLKEGLLVKDTANIVYTREGTLDTSNAVEGYFAADLTNTAFGHKYNDVQKTEDGEEKKPLYAVVISNTMHPDDSAELIKALCR